MYRVKFDNSKYGSTKHEYNGRTYHSKAEAHYAQELDLRKRAGEVRDWEPQHKINLEANGRHICTYIPDFLVTLADGSQELHEVKGFSTETYRLKRKILEATYLIDHPEITFIEVRV
jgi:Protein of unknown function (DUF1064)